MDISVILAVYGAERYIEECLRSLFTQTKTSGVEFILVNDCTPDSSIEIAKRIIAEYRGIDAKIINHDVNCGVAVARQTGVDAASGEYTIHIDPDDWCEPTMLEEMYNAAKAEDADIFCCDFYENYSNQEIYIEQKLATDNLLCIDKFIAGGLHSSLCNKLIKRDLIVANGIRMIPNLNIWEDMMFCIKCFSYTNKISYINRAYLHYRQNNTSLTHTIPLNRIQNKIDAVKEIEQFLTNTFPDNVFFDSLTTFKIRFKHYLLKNSKGGIQVNHSKFYPELDSYVDSHFKVRWIHQFLYKQALKGRLYIFNFGYFILGLKKVIYSKNYNY